MKFKLQKKKKAWDLFRNEIKILIGISISLTLGITVWLNWRTIIKLFDWLNIKPIDFLAYFIALPFIILFMMSYLTTIIKYLYRHLYIPLTHEELEANNIHTLEEYVNFLSCLFMGNCPLERVHEEIKLTAKELNAKSDEILCCFLDKDNLIIVYGIFIFFTTLGSLILMTTGLNYFLCLYASLLLVSHLPVSRNNISFFKIARMKEEKK